MTDVVSVIGDLERVLQATTTTTSQLPFNPGYPSLCVNCATPTSSGAAGAVDPAATGAVAGAMRAADSIAAQSVGSGK